MSALSRSQRRDKSLRLRRSVFLVLLGLVLAVAVVKLSGPLGTLRAQEDRLAQLRLGKAALMDERARLEGHLLELATEQGQEAAARRQGYLREGERRLVFVKEQTADPADGAAEENIPPKP